MRAPVVDPSPWRRLAKEARKAADAPEQPVTLLARAEKAARRSTVIGALSPENPCVQLVRSARQFVAARDRNRRALKPGLLGAVEHLERLLAPASLTADPDPPAAPYRADIDG